MKSNIAKVKYILLEVCTFLIMATMLAFSISKGKPFRDTLHYIRLELVVIWSLILAILSEIICFVYFTIKNMVDSYKIWKRQNI